MHFLLPSWEKVAAKRPDEGGAEGVETSLRSESPLTRQPYGRHPLPRGEWGIGGIEPKP